VRAGVSSTAALSLCLLLLAVSFGHAQSALPLPGFVPPYEVAKIVREAGYDPLTRPRREGSTYVVRATNHRGILMRVVIDARSGAIRAVNRIVPAPYGMMGMMPPPYGDPYDQPVGPLPGGPPPPYGVAPYGPASAPPPYAVAPYGPAAVPPRYSQPYPPPPYPPPYDAPAEYGMAPGMPGPPGGPMEADLNGPPPPGYGHPSIPSRPPRPRSPGLATHEAKPPRAADEKPVEVPAVRSEPAPSAATVVPPVAPEVRAPAVPPTLPPAASAPAASAPPVSAPAAPAKRAPMPPIQD
jgi:hypothetical protein